MPVQPIDDLLSRLRERTPQAGSTRVLAIDGPSGSGKTTLAARIAARSGPDSAPVIHLDDIYPGWDGLAQAPGLLVEGVLRPLRDGRPAAYHRWDWEAGERAERHDVPATELLIVEGVGSGALACAPFLSMLVWIEAPLDVRMRRGIERDGEAYHPHWERWAAQERDLFASDRTRERADVLVDGDSAAPHARDREVVLLG